MAIVENRSTEIGDVIRIQTDVPIIGLISLTSFMDNTEGENEGSPSGVIPRYDDNQGNTPTYNRSIQVNEIRYSVLAGNNLRSIISLNLSTGVYSTNFPQSPDSITIMAHGNNNLYLFTRIYDADNNSYGFSVRELNLSTLVFSTSVTFTNTGDFSANLSHNAISNQLYYWARPDINVNVAYTLYRYDTQLRTITQVNNYPVNSIQPFTPVSDVTNSRIYFTVRISAASTANRLAVYDVINDTYQDLPLYEANVGRFTFNQDANLVHAVDARIITTPQGRRAQNTIATYNVGVGEWTSNNVLSPPSLSAVNYISYYSGRLFALSGFFVTEVYTIASQSWATAGGVTSRFFEKQFRISLDGGLNFTPFQILNDVNVNNITVQRNDQFVLEVTYRRSGTDTTGELAFNSFTLSGDFAELGFPIYDMTIFKKLFEVNDANVLRWALNVLEKIYQRGLLADYVDRNRENKDDTDFIVYWNSVTHLFALIVYFARNFENISANKTILIEYLNNFDITIPFDQNLEDLGYIYSNRPDEYRKRGTNRITFARGENNEEIDGELLRELNKQPDDLLIFALIEAQKFGWCLGESSPTWTGTENIKNLTLAYEFTKSVNDLDLYPLINIPGISLFQDTDISEQVLRITHGNADPATGIGYSDIASPDRTKLILIDPTIPYEISVKVKKTNGTNDGLFFGAYGYDSNFVRGDLIPVWNSVNNPNRFMDEDIDETLKVNDEYYWLRAVLFPVGTSQDDDLVLNFPSGRGLILNATTNYIGIYFYVDGNVTVTLNVYDIKMRPLNLPISQGLFGVKNIIAGYLKNNGELSNEDLRIFTQNRLIPYNSFLIPKFL